MQFIGRLIQVCEVQSGPSRNGGEWRRQDIILETDGQYPKKVCVAIWGDRIDAARPLFQIGALLDVSFDLDSREFNGKWYTSVTAWKIDAAGAVPAQPSATSSSAMPTPPPALLPSDDADDLPF